MPGEVGTIDREQEQIDKALALGLYEVVEVITEDAPAVEDAPPTEVVVDQELPTGTESDPALQDLG